MFTIGICWFTIELGEVRWEVLGSRIGALGIAKKTDVQTLVF